MAKLDERIGFLGGGNMAFAIGYGLINRGICTSPLYTLYEWKIDPHPALNNNLQCIYLWHFP